MGLPWRWTSNQIECLWAVEGCIWMVNKKIGLLYFSNCKREVLTKYLIELIFQNYMCEARNKIKLLLKKLPICKAASYVQELILLCAAHYFVLHTARPSLIHKARQGWHTGLLAPIQDLNKDWTSVFFHGCMVKFQELLNLNWLNTLDANRVTLVITFKIWITSIYLRNYYKTMYTFHFSIILYFWISKPHFPVLSHFILY